MTLALRPKAPTSPVNLAEVIAPLDVDEFLEEYWGKKPLFMKAQNPRRFTGLFSMEQFEQMLRLNKLPLFATFNDYGNESATKFKINNEITINPQQRECIRAMTRASLTLSNLQTEDAGICVMLAGFKRDLRHAGGIRCSAWWSKAGTGLPTHFDESTSFMLQIEGRKTWRCSTGPAVEYPNLQGLLGEHREAMYLNFHTPGINQKVDDWMRVVAHTDESKFIEFTMEPGDACFIPAGVWHTTTAIDNERASLGLNIRMNHLSMWDLFSGVLKKELLKKPAWRSLPVTGNSYSQILSEMIVDLRERISALSPEELNLEWEWLQAISEFNGRGERKVDLRPDTRLRLSKSRPLVSYGEETDGPIVIFAGDGSMKFYEKKFIPFARQLLHGEEFSAISSGKWFSEPCKWEELRGILQTLLKEGIVEPA